MHRHMTCRLAMLQGYSYVPPHDDEALMEALYSRGTIAISLDASQPSFRFYASGGCPCRFCVQPDVDADKQESAGLCWH